MFDGDLNPHYFQNPATFTYLVYFALQLHGFDDIASQYLADPTEIYEIARLVAVALSLARRRRRVRGRAPAVGRVRGRRRRGRARVRVPAGRLLALRA